VLGDRRSPAIGLIEVARVVVDEGRSADPDALVVLVSQKCYVWVDFLLTSFWLLGIGTATQIPSLIFTLHPPLSFQLKVDASHPYLSERGLTPTTIETFGLGYCVSERSIMRHRILIPIHNEKSELVAYGGRWPGDAGWPEGTDKYMLPPKFEKLRVLFNLHRVSQGIVADLWPDHDRHIVVVEGYFGVFAVHELAPCVALMGSSVSAHHVRLLLETNIRYVTLLLDGPTKPETEEQSENREQKISAATYQLASNGLFVHTPKLGIGEQPDTIDPKLLTQLVVF
jgi:DNA primase catalytic core, N-terminal domain